MPDPTLITFAALTHSILIIALSDQYSFYLCFYGIKTWDSGRQSELPEVTWLVNDNVGISCKCEALSLNFHFQFGYMRKINENKISRPVTSAISLNAPFVALPSDMSRVWRQPQAVLPTSSPFRMHIIVYMFLTWMVSSSFILQFSYVDSTNELFRNYFLAINIAPCNGSNFRTIALPPT